MTEPNPDPNVEAMIVAARDRDAVRTCFLMDEVYREDGTVQFARTVLVALWKARYPSDNGPGSSAILQRLSRAGQVLGRTLAVVRDGQTTIITDSAMVQWLAARDPMIASLPPGVLNLNVSVEDVAQIEQMLSARTGQQTMGGVGEMTATATVGRAGDVVADSGWVLHADAEVVKGGG